MVETNDTVQRLQHQTWQPRSKKFNDAANDLAAWLADTQNENESQPKRDRRNGHKHPETHEIEAALEDWADAP